MFAYVDFPSWVHAEVVSFLPVRWYAVMYLVAFAIAYVIFRRQCRDGVLGHMDAETSQDAFIYVIIGLILGARLFSTLLYDGSSYYWTHPWMIFWPFRNGRFVGLPGMSYHGGVVGGMVGGLLFCKKNKYNFIDFCDAIFLSVPLGYTFGRLGNFINGELWGRCTGKSFGMVFPNAPSFSTRYQWVREAADAAGISYADGSLVNLPRWPSQLFEAFFEGVFLFAVLWFVIRPIARNKEKAFGPGFLSGAYLCGYGVLRFAIEYLREPDKELGFIIALGKETEPVALFKSLFNISMGQILCFIMIVAGILLIIHSCKTQPVVYKSVNKKAANKGKKA